jgi:hypothetical protein
MKIKLSSKHRSEMNSQVCGRVGGVMSQCTATFLAPENILSLFDCLDAPDFIPAGSAQQLQYVNVTTFVVRS